MTDTTTMMAVPADLRLEAEVLGSIIARYASCEQIRPEHFYDPRHAAILTAWRTLHTRPAQTYSIVRDGTGDYHPHVHIVGLVSALTALAPARASDWYLYARRITTDAPVTGRQSVMRLRLLAGRRRALARLADRQRELLGSQARVW